MADFPSYLSRALPLVRAYALERFAPTWEGGAMAVPFTRSYALERYAATQAGTLLDRRLVAVAADYGSAPQITNISPPVGSTLSPSSQVQFDVLDETWPIPLVAVFCRQGTAYEVVHDGVEANPRFGVQRLDIDGGYRFVVSAVGGWTSSPQFVVRAIDLGGQLG